MLDFMAQFMYIILEWMHSYKCDKTIVCSWNYLIHTQAHQTTRSVLKWKHIGTHLSRQWFLVLFIIVSLMRQKLFLLLNEPNLHIMRNDYKQNCRFIVCALDASSSGAVYTPWWNSFSQSSYCQKREQLTAATTNILFHVSFVQNDTEKLEKNKKFFQQPLQKKEFIPKMRLSQIPPLGMSQSECDAMAKNKIIYYLDGRRLETCSDWCYMVCAAGKAEDNGCSKIIPQLDFGAASLYNVRRTLQKRDNARFNRKKKL